MKNNIITFIAIIGIGLLFSCKKDETRVLLKDTPDKPGISSPSDGTTKVLTLADSAKNILFTWSKANFGYDATVSYALQIDKSGNNFKKPSNIATTILKDSAMVNIYNLDNTLLAMGLVENQAANIEIRVRAIVTAINSSAFADTAMSSVIKMTVTPFPIIVNYPKLYVPGSYNSWADPAAAGVYTVSSVNSDDTYEGYMYFPDATTTFKMLRNPKWEQDNTIGDPNASGTSGTLQIGNWGGNNISISGGPGYFKFNCDLNAKTYSFLKTAWAISGDFNSWADTPLTYDINKRTWSVTTNLTTGGLKFKLVGSWNLNYGDNNANGKLQPNGSNIAVTAAGNYTVTLDLSGAIYKYTLVKN